VKDELDGFAETNPNFRVFHTLTRHNDEKHGEWNGLKGRISADLLKQCGFPEPSPETLILHCGPPEFNKTVKAVLAELGYTADMQYNLWFSSSTEE